MGGTRPLLLLFVLSSWELLDRNSPEERRYQSLEPPVGSEVVSGGIEDAVGTLGKIDGAGESITGDGNAEDRRVFTLKFWLGLGLGFGGSGETLEAIDGAFESRRRDAVLEDAWLPTRGFESF